MADTGDIANDRAEIDLGFALAAARKPVPRLTFTGICHCCEERVESPKRFCDSDCADMWERKRNRK